MESNLKLNKKIIVKIQHIAKLSSMESLVENNHCR